MTVDENSPASERELKVWWAERRHKQVENRPPKLWTFFGMGLGMLGVLVFGRALPDLYVEFVKAFYSDQLLLRLWPFLIVVGLALLGDRAYKRVRAPALATLFGIGYIALMLMAPISGHFLFGHRPLEAMPKDPPLYQASQRAGGEAKAH
jgi:hypothetical protein